MGFVYRSFSRDRIVQFFQFKRVKWICWDWNWFLPCGRLARVRVPYPAIFWKQNSPGVTGLCGESINFLNNESTLNRSSFLYRVCYEEGLFGIYREPEQGLVNLLCRVKMSKIIEVSSVASPVKKWESIFWL